MSASRVFDFSDPYPYQQSIRAAQTEIVVTAGGRFHAELIQIDLPRLWLQRGRESLPRIFNTALSAERTPIGFLVGDQAAVRHDGVEVPCGDIVFNASASAFHRRTSAPTHWAAMSLTPGDLAAAGRAFAVEDLVTPRLTHVVKPGPVFMSRLLSLHEAAAQLARTAPELLCRPEVARALDDALVHAMITCLTDGDRAGPGLRGRQHAVVIQRLEELLETKHDRPLYISEICAATGASERVLRVCCHDHLGMGPVRYLRLRRMHLARRALLLADAAKATVTDIATQYGFWELGRFAVEYRALFGDRPRRRCAGRRAPTTNHRNARPTCRLLNSHSASPAYPRL